jgi:hypothetical protein
VDELVAFVRACLDEDERVIRDRWDSDGRARVATMWTGGEPGYTTVASDHGDGVWIADGREVTDARRVQVLFDPARVLAEVAAKRAIVDLHHRVDDDYPNGWPENPSCAGCHAGYDEEPWTEHINDCPELRILAGIYAGRPGWREEWAT